MSGHWVVNTKAQYPVPVSMSDSDALPHLSVSSPLEAAGIPRMASEHMCVRALNLSDADPEKRNHVICYPTIYNCISRQHAHANPGQREMTSSQNYYESKQAAIFGIHSCPKWADFWLRLQNLPPLSISMCPIQFYAMLNILYIFRFLVSVVPLPAAPCFMVTPPNPVP